VQAGMAIVNFVINFQLVKYGALTPIGADDALAAIGVVQRIGQFSVMPLIGIAIALQPLLGFNYGAHNVNRVRKTLWYGIGAASSGDSLHAGCRSTAKAAAPRYFPIFIIIVSLAYT
jgi:Na+-driven multidrug efflux pump